MEETIVLGLGLSGLAAAEFLLKQGVSVLGVDGNRALLDSLKEKGMRCCHESEMNAPFTRLVVSPGISPNHPLYRRALENGIEVIGEAELALPHFRKPLIAITGTNGKTTVTLLIEHILNAAGVRAKALGNVGTALCDYLLHPAECDAFVVELSSFQLETMRTPVFDAAVLLNITPDHLDRYGSMQEYAQAKCHLEALVKEGGAFYVHSTVVAEYGNLLKNYQTYDKIESIIPMDYRDWGRHDVENALAAWAVCRGFSIDAAAFRAALLSFKKPPHRIEFVSEIDGVYYYDDSKGTNIDASIQAVNAMKGPVILIAGGMDKGASYLLWKDPFLKKVKSIIAIGQAASKIERELNPYFNIKRAETLEDAVALASSIAEKGDHVLLSPGCSSYDMFRDYAHRGEEFQRHVKRRKS